MSLSLLGTEEATEGTFSFGPGRESFHPDGIAGNFEEEPCNKKKRVLTDDLLSLGQEELPS